MYIPTYHHFNGHFQMNVVYPVALPYCFFLPHCLEDIVGLAEVRWPGCNESHQLAPNCRYRYLLPPLETVGISTFIYRPDALSVTQ